MRGRSNGRGGRDVRLAWAGRSTSGSVSVSTCAIPPAQGAAGPTRPSASTATACTGWTGSPRAFWVVLHHLFAHVFPTVYMGGGVVKRMGAMSAVTACRNVSNDEGSASPPWLSIAVSPRAIWTLHHQPS